jgi:hypothetical protein
VVNLHNNDILGKVGFKKAKILLWRRKINVKFLDIFRKGCGKTLN